MDPGIAAYQIEDQDNQRGDFSPPEMDRKKLIKEFSSDSEEADPKKSKSSAKRKEDQVMSSSDDEKSSSENYDQEDSSSQSESESDEDEEVLAQVANKLSFPALIMDKIIGDDKK